MTLQELKVALMEIRDREDYDPEMDHAHADNLLLAYIDDLGVTEIWEQIQKWYA